MGLSYAIYDVFTAQKFAGNPLAVVFDAEELDTAQMQTIAAEFNLSETVFVVPASDANHSASLRIFTPRAELPFAGHPTIGAAIAIAERDGLDSSGRILMLGETIGPIRAVVSQSEPLFAEFDLPKLPVEAPMSLDRPSLARALGIDEERLGFENHEPSCYSAGVPFAFIPLRSRADVEAVTLDASAWDQLAPQGDLNLLPPTVVYCRETVRTDAQFHMRMFAPRWGIAEDPATGAAAAAFLGAVMAFDRPRDGDHVFTIEQGVEMGRPSLLRVEYQTEHATILAARLGGHAVRIADGTLLL